MPSNQPVERFDGIIPSQQNMLIERKGSNSFPGENMSLQISQKQQVLATIAARASTPPERLQTCYELCQATMDSTVQRRQQRLEQVLGGRNGEALARFCAQSHLDHEQIIKMLSPVQLKELTQLPDWIEPLESIFALASTSLAGEEHSSDLDRSQRPDSPLPFEDVLLPFVEYARVQLQTCAAKAYPCLSEQAHAQMEHWLLGSLSMLAGKALQREFSIFRIQHSPFAYDFREDHTHTDLYRRFVEHYRGKHFWPFFLEYSVLARLLLLKLGHWIDACQEFLLHLEADISDLAEVFFQGQPLGSVVAIQPGCSDPHRHGRTVFLLTFSAERQLLYKPRNMRVDQAFSDLLAWATACGLSPALKGPQILSRDTYGWMEYVPWMPCQTTQEVEHYYLRFGLLLCLLYLLGGTDMHCGNLIACGDMPVLIDLETVIGADFPWLLLSHEKAARGLNTIEHTILRSGLLPGKFTEVGILRTIDVSALGGGKELESPELLPCFQHVNTNAMILKNEPVSLKEVQHNQVMLRDTMIQPLDYQEEIVAGFRRMYHLLLAQQAVLLAPEGPLRAFDGCPLRSVVRPTYFYWKVLDVLSSPACLRDGADHWIEVQFLQRPLRNATTSSNLQVLINAEISALEHLDIPWFGTHTQSQDLLTDSNVVIKEVFNHSALELLRQRLVQFGDVDLECQTRLIGATFLTIPSVKLDAAGKGVSPAESLDENDLLTPESLVNVASELARRLIQVSLRGRHGEIVWIGFHYDTEMEEYQLQTMGPDLYEGICGIALFLAACAFLTGQTLYRDFAIEAIRPLAEHLPNSSVASVPQGPSTMIGGAAGLGSWIYALTRLSQWLGRSDLLHAATQAAWLITSERVQADHHLDVIAGAGGAILGLLALYEVTANEEILQRALLCGEHLLGQRVEIEEGVRAWRGHDGTVRTGFSHGAAGIAYALLRLYAVTQRREFQEAACEAINYERLTFVPEVGNWPEFRSLVTPDTQQSCMTSWCYGAAGIGLARLGGLTVLDTPAVRQELEVALSTTLASGLPSLDNLCCGNFGRIEFLLASAQRLQRPDLLVTAQRQVSTLVRRAAQQGDFHLLAHLPRQASHPGLFQGYAGIGYELLRLAAPGRIPSVLLWE